MQVHFHRVVRFATLTLLIAALCVGLGSAGAQDAPEFDPLTATSNVNVLRAEAVRAGSLRVIVGVQADYNGLAGLDSVSADSARSQISRSAQDALVSSLAASGVNVQVVRQFDYLPFMVLRVNAAALDALAANPLVTSIENDALAMVDMSSSAGVIGASGTGGAWDMGYTGEGFTVAVLDTGVDKAHPALSGQVVSEACYNTTEPTNQSTSRCPGGDTSTAVGSGVDCTFAFAAGCEHGTHVAGTVASTDATERGIAPDASIIAINVFSFFPVTFSICAANYGDDCLLTYTGDQIDGMERVYELRETYDIAAINMSLGGGSYTSEATCDTDNASRKDAIDLLRGVGIASVISTGNSYTTSSIGAPGCISTAIGVSATEDDDDVAVFSSVANIMEVFAPGVNINSAKSGTSTFQNFNGTSMASPHVAGAWAVLREAKPDASVTELLNVLVDTGVSVTDQRSGGSVTKPRIQLNDALVELLAADNNLLVNGNFDDNDDATPNMPDGWNGLGKLLGDRVRTDGAKTFSNSAPNAFQFTGKPNEKNSKIAQSVDLLSQTFEVGDSLTLSAFVDQRSAKVNVQIGQLVIKYNDATPTSKVKLRMPAVKTPGYVEVETDPIVLSSTDIAKISVQLLYKVPTGKFYIDDVSLTLTNATVLASDGLVPVPAAPGAADLRGQ